MSRLPHFPSHSNDHNGNATIFTAPNIDNVHHYELVRLAWVRIAYLDPSLHLVSTLHSLRFFLRPDSSVHLCSPALALAHLFPCPDSSIHLCSPALALAHSDSFHVLCYARTLGTFLSAL